MSKDTYRAFEVTGVREFALVQIDARPGALVAIQGIGGLGHAGLYAARLGYRVAAVARGTDKADLASREG